MPSLSVAMASFNGAAFIGPQLASLAAQTRLPDELVVCDDGSSDATVAMVQAFAVSAPFPVFLHRNPVRLGYRANFMQAAALARGDLISFCDQDDVWHPDKLRRVTGAFDDPSIMLVVHRAELIDAQNTMVGVLDQQPVGSPCIDVFTAQGPWCLFYGFSQTFRAALMDHADLWRTSKSHFQPDLIMGHDRWISFVAASLGQVVSLPDRLVQYRQHEGNAYGVSLGGQPVAPGKAARRERIGHDDMRTAFARSAVGDRIRMLRVLTARAGADANAPLKRAIRLYSALENRLVLRQRVQQGLWFGARLDALIRLLIARAYREGDPWRFGMAAFRDDISVNLPLGPTYRAP